MTIENVNTENELLEINGKLSDLREEISENSEIKTTAKDFGIPSDITNEYINILKDFYAPNKINNGLMDKKLEAQLGIELGELDSESSEMEITNQDGILLYYIKKLCPNKYKDIMLLIIKALSNERICVTPGRLNAKYGTASIKPNAKIETQNTPSKDIIKYIELYGDDAYDVLKFCSPFTGSYLKNTIAKFSFKDKNGENGLGDCAWEDEESRAMITQFFENFVYESESINLLKFLKNNPQKLENLGGKEIQSINLSLDSGINFAFRGIIEMVKSRPDINFPHLKDNASESEKAEWEKERTKIIKEYESLLRNYIARDSQEGKDKVDNKKPFDKIFFTKANGDDVIDDFNLLPDNWVQQFSGSEIKDYSYNKLEDSKEKKEEISKKMLLDIENYVREHPDEKILICIEHHGGSDGSSGNGRSKEDWLRLANLSTNIKILSTRCYFGTAFENKDIYKYKASVSGFSNLSTTGANTVNEALNRAFSKGLGFHEMEIYTRLNYPVSVTPLTESMKYTDRNTGEPTIGKVGLAHNDNQNNKSDVSYA